MSGPKLSRPNGLFAVVAAITLVRPGGGLAQVCLDEGTVYVTTEAAVNDAPFSVVNCDLDGDGDEDLATANDASDTVSILLNDGAGGFDSLRRWPIGSAVDQSEPVDLACCDLDGDARLDLVTVNHTSDNISILYNAGNLDGVPQFTQPFHHPVGEAPWAVGCGRIDADAHNDIVTANFTSDSVSVLLNDGQGGVDPGTSYTVVVGDAPRSMVLCDVDGDGDLDVLTGNMSGQSVTLLRNDGVDGLVDAGDTPVGVNPFDITCCDLDGANGPDIITANIIDDSVSTLLNNGSGVFSDLAHTPGSDGAISVACSDVDRDRDLDIVTANLSSDDISIFHNDGGVLSVPVAMPVGPSPSSVACGGLVSPAGADLAVAFADGVLVAGNVCGPTGDVDGDLDTDLADYAAMQVCFGQPVVGGGCESADLDASGEVDLGDFAVLHHALTNASK